MKNFTIIEDIAVRLNEELYYHRGHHSEVDEELHYHREHCSEAE